jgi:hypothetical protein
MGNDRGDGMRVRVATEGVRFVVVADSAAKTDREGRQRVDSRTGALLWQLALVPIGDEFMREAITVTLDSEVKVAPGEFVEVADLVASTWETEGRWGVAFRAGRVVPAKAAKPGSFASLASSSGSTSTSAA